MHTKLRSLNKVNWNLTKFRIFSNFKTHRSSIRFYQVLTCLFDVFRLKKKTKRLFLKWSCSPRTLWLKLACSAAEPSRPHHRTRSPTWSRTSPSQVQLCPIHLMLRVINIDFILIFSIPICFLFWRLFINRRELVEKHVLCGCHPGHHSRQHQRRVLRGAPPEESWFPPVRVHAQASEGD